MRKAALEASTYDEPAQKAVAFHEQRVREITGGDHELDEDPQVIAHMIPEGYPKDGSLTEGPIEQSPPPFRNEPTHTETHRYGRVTKSANPTREEQAYNLHMYAGGVEAVSGGEISEFNGGLFEASRTEAKLAVTANWAQMAFEGEGDSLVVLVSLVNIEGEEVRIPDRARGIATNASDATFSADTVAPWPVKVPLETVEPTETFNQLHGLFDRLWTDTGLSSSPFYNSGGDAAGVMRDFINY